MCGNAYMFNLLQFTFSHLWVVIIYVLACISLLYHLLHGFQSAFRTIGFIMAVGLLLLNQLELVILL
jgi:succinate dehydrogenase / fumarate reductase cytochrome b subunit